MPKSAHYRTIKQKNPSAKLQNVQAPAMKKRVRARLHQGKIGAY